MTDKTLLAKVQQALAPADVYLKDAHAHVAKEFDAKSAASAGLEFQIRYGLQGDAEMLDAAEPADPGRTLPVLRYLADTGVRFTGSETESEKEPLVRAEITATWVVEYRIVKPDVVDEDGIREFGMNNVMFHVWPYWREFIHASCARLRLPQVVLPMFFVRRPQGDANAQPPPGVDDTVKR